MNKKAFSLPIVMILLVISQLVYMALVRFNQTKLQQYRLFIDYYQAEIQQEIAMNIAEEMFISQFEEDIESFSKEYEWMMADRQNYMLLNVEADKIADLSFEAYLYADQEDNALYLIEHSVEVEWKENRDYEKKPIGKEIMVKLNNWSTENYWHEYLKKRNNRREENIALALEGYVEDGEPKFDSKRFRWNNYPLLDLSKMIRKVYFDRGHAEFSMDRHPELIVLTSFFENGLKRDVKILRPSVKSYRLVTKCSRYVLEDNDTDPTDDPEDPPPTDEDDADDPEDPVDDATIDDPEEETAPTS